MDQFVLHSEYKPTGDQPEAIAELTQGVQNGYREQALMGVTGSGKTFTMANIIANVNRPDVYKRQAQNCLKLQRIVCLRANHYRFPARNAKKFVSLQPNLWTLVFT